jgi:hypothetical protein
MNGASKLGLALFACAALAAGMISANADIDRAYANPTAGIGTIVALNPQPLPPRCQPPHCKPNGGGAKTRSFGRFA